MNETTEGSGEVDTEDNFITLIDFLRGSKATQRITKREGMLSSYSLCKELS
jgi:hypothetical protein